MVSHCSIFSFFGILTCPAVSFTFFCVGTCLYVAIIINFFPSSSNLMLVFITLKEFCNFDMIILFSKLILYLTIVSRFSLIILVFVILIFDSGCNLNFFYDVSLFVYFFLYCFAYSCMLTHLLSLVRWSCSANSTSIGIWDLTKQVSAIYLLFLRWRLMLIWGIKWEILFTFLLIW